MTSCFWPSLKWRSNTADKKYMELFPNTQKTKLDLCPKKHFNFFCPTINLMRYGLLSYVLSGYDLLRGWLDELSSSRFVFPTMVCWALFCRNMVFQTLIGWARFSLTYSGFIFMQDLIIFWHSDAEDDGCDVLKTMNPFLSLWPLTTNIEQSEKRISWL